MTVVEGRFHDVSGTARFDPHHPSSASGVARIGTASIDTGDEEMDASHRGPDVLDADAHPHIVLLSRSVAAAGDGRYQMVGDLTIRGITRPVVFGIEYGGVRTDRRGDRRPAMTLTGSIDRGDFGLTQSLLFRRLLGTRIDLAIEVQLVETADADKVA
jgi:polyisoprenoid-binding protein YceI